ncbi:DUF1254 domain-containing protein [Olleya sp. R77988]|uniref:DUF1254 domain-containing protein n=1 Tax=Olleya sp. R77988 TaxID=3093875 RepID=UPI0037C83A28
MKKIVKHIAVAGLAILCFQCKENATPELETKSTPQVEKVRSTSAVSIEEVKALDNEAKRQLGENIGIQSYIYSIPVVREMLFRNKFSAMVDKAIKANRPMFSKNANDGVNLNELVHLRLLTNHHLQTGVTPNVDTQYSPAFIDVSEGPVVFTVPKVERYYSVQITDAYLENVHYFGGTNKEDYEGNYLLVKPDWTGKKPANISKVIKMTTDIGFLVLRILNTTEKGDTKKVVALQDQFKMQSLDAFLGKKKDNYPVLAKEKMPKGIEFYNSMLKYVRAYPDLKNDTHFWFLMKQLGIDKDEKVDFNELDSSIKEGLLAALPKAKEILSWKARTRGYKSSSNWNIDHVGGSYNGDIMARAEGAVQGFVVHDADQCQYFHTYYDKAGDPLLGSNKYVINFSKDQLHQAKAFWSIVAYDAEYNLVPREDYHYAVSDRSEGLKYNDDGSLTVYLQSEEPEGLKNNWVPIPKEGIFKLNFRNYIPKETLLNPETVEKYLPPVEKNDKDLKL